MKRAGAASDPSARTRALAVVLAGTFLGGLDTYVVNLALPTIANDLGVDLAAISWVLLAYLLAIGGLVVTVGRVADVRGTRPVFTAGAAIFTLGAALAALAPGLAWLVAARSVQGIGAAMLLVAGQAIVAGLFGPGERAGRWPRPARRSRRPAGSALVVDDNRGVALGLGDVALAVVARSCVSSNASCPCSSASSSVSPTPAVSGSVYVARGIARWSGRTLASDRSLLAWRTWAQSLARALIWRQCRPLTRT